MGDVEEGEVVGDAGGVGGEGRMACPARLAAIARPPPRVRRRTAATVAATRPTLILVGIHAHSWDAMAIADRR